MKHFIFPRYSAPGCRRPTQAPSIRVCRLPSPCKRSQGLPRISPQTCNGCYHEEVWAQESFPACPKASPGFQSFFLSPPRPQFQDESKSYLCQKSHTASGCLATLLERAPWHEYVLGRNMHEATRVFPQGKLHTGHQELLDAGRVKTSKSY